ncbi:hypothetical protein C8F04DRAFT_1182343 [Mycena alexandri]|uniref:Uncharacterized protein n=1 Tax=Mycena alexandri TaxID=1745969 RepID=A0AAD6X592_9AGAR|nr:hypothetical protein C8F04DRAFT_1182343 [Mycena alexandri]
MVFRGEMIRLKVTTNLKFIEVMDTEEPCCKRTARLSCNPKEGRGLTSVEHQPITLFPGFCPDFSGNEYDALGKIHGKYLTAVVKFEGQIPAHETREMDWVVGLSSQPSMSRRQRPRSRFAHMVDGQTNERNVGGEADGRRLNGELGLSVSGRRESVSGELHEKKDIRRPAVESQDVGMTSNRPFPKREGPRQEWGIEIHAHAGGHVHFGQQRSQCEVSSHSGRII